MPLASWWTATRPGTPAPSVNWRRTRWPGPFGRDHRDVDLGAGSIWPKWIEKPCANSSRLPGAIPSLISDSQISACFSSGSRIITTSPRLAASAIVVDLEAVGLGLVDRRLSRDAGRPRRSTPESFRFSACAWPWEP